jgi:hypothetical protein
MRRQAAENCSSVYRMALTSLVTGRVEIIGRSVRLRESPK